MIAYLACSENARVATKAMKTPVEKENKTEQSQATRKIFPGGIKNKYLSAASRSSLTNNTENYRSFSLKISWVAPQYRETFDSYDVTMLKLELREHGRNDVTVTARAA